MSRALQLAERGVYTTRPNPRAGCVLVKGGEIIAEGWHVRAGQAHAEVHAIQQVNPDGALGATAYVTLEPCAHQGKTGACSSALIDAGIERVVYALEDPNPLVSGKGLRLLQNAGVCVEGPLLAQQAAALNQGFMMRMSQGRPWVRCKLATSLDGGTAMQSGESQWITGSAARKDVQRLRAQSCAIITGIGSIVEDDSRLTVRANELLIEDVDNAVTLPPLRVVVDSTLRIDSHAALFSEPESIIIFTGKDVPLEKEQLLCSGLKENTVQANVVIERVELRAGRVDLHQVLACLADRYQCNDVLVEAGATLAGAFLQAGILDAFIIYQAPILLGSEARSLVEVPMNTMQEKIELEITDQRSVGNDIRITAKVKKSL